VPAAAAVNILRQPVMKARGFLFSWSAKRPVSDLSLTGVPFCVFRIGQDPWNVKKTFFLKQAGHWVLEKATKAGR